MSLITQQPRLEACPLVPIPQPVLSAGLMEFVFPKVLVVALELSAQVIAQAQVMFNAAPTPNVRLRMAVEPVNKLPNAPAKHTQVIVLVHLIYNAVSLLLPLPPHHPLHALIPAPRNLPPLGPLDRMVWIC